ncbi:MAG: hypothetical protein ACOY3P_12065 [Planctomycetota bacterium]
MTPSERDLIDAFLGDRLAAKDHAALQELLRRDADARRLLRDLATVEVKLEQLASAVPAPVNSTSRDEAIETQTKRRPLWLNWRPLAAAAAGLALGIFSASMVWAYAVPFAGRTNDRTVTVLAEGFEDSRLAPGRGFPTVANRWSGDVSAPVGAESDVKPSEGGRMVRLTLPPKRTLSYAWRIVDLAEHPEAATAKSLRLEVAASFNTSGPARSLRYQIRLAAFSQKPSEVRAIWNNEPVLFDSVLQHVGRNMLTKPGDTGWQTVNAALEIPPGTRSVVISLAAGEADPAQPLAEHYLDDAHARFVITQTPVE